MEELNPDNIDWKVAEYHVMGDSNPVISLGAFSGLECWRLGLLHTIREGCIPRRLIAIVVIGRSRGHDFAVLMHLA